ncbi:hypothetical protein GV67_21815 [Pseudorhizobium pelagicum]|uniref:Uncharacterized protein n=1 Tax=Pseudorhizobium pelagicum TaxID=1509405 RepID=A0A922NWU4_9HYPH|nr:hypothetical protein GV68_12600 [Pseudorhizobium pelagicum]KEQ07410.1 hypothetical protein GV67_21815 [Pseudorhizobium pelagicum]
MLRVLHALDLTSASVGKPFSLCRIDSEGAHHLSEEEIQEVGDVVSRWEDAEQAVIAKIFD